MKVMIVVTHLLGTGHLSRALTLGRAFGEQGHEVLVVSGGMPAPQLNSEGMTLLGLPPLRSDGTDFARLLNQSGTVADQDYLMARITALVEAIASFEPHVLITELFPFGRRSLSGEFLALLDAAKAMAQRPIVLSSIRDILAPPSKPSKADRTDEIIADCYDGVLVHSDPDVVPLEISWPVSDRIAGRLHYTGFVAPTAPKPHEDSVGQDEIIVSAGGGSVGQPIFRAAIEAARKMPNRRWRLLVGGQDADARIHDFMTQAGDLRIVIEPVRPDYRQMLPLAAASVSMCGYNTAMDLLQSGTPAVLVPFDDGKEVEQGLRAQSLARMPGIEILKSSELGGQALADALNIVIADGGREPLAKGFDGAQKAVQITEHLLKARR